MLWRAKSERAAARKDARERGVERARRPRRDARVAAVSRQCATVSGARCYHVTRYGTIITTILTRRHTASRDAAAYAIRAYNAVIHATLIRAPPLRHERRAARAQRSRRRFT